MDSLEPLQPNEKAFEEAGGANIHIRGTLDMGKTNLAVHLVRYIVSSLGYSPSEGVGNLTLKGEIGQGFTVLKGSQLKNWLLDCTHVPYRHKFAIIDEIDSLFPARDFMNREQTEVANRLWHTRKLRNYIIYTSHLGHSTDVIMHNAANFVLYPMGIDWENDTLDYIVENRFDNTVYEMTAYYITSTMRLYSRHEATELTEEDSGRIKALREKNKKKNSQVETSKLVLPENWNAIPSDGIPEY